MIKKLSIAGEEINAYFEDGLEESNKPVLVFLHGFGDSWTTVKPIMNFKNRPFVVASFDMPGCGYSTWNIRPLKLEHNFEVAEEFINKYLKGREVYIVAHSLGSLSALHCLKTTNAKYASLVGCSNYVITPQKVEFGKKFLIPLTKENAMESYVKLTAHPEQFESESKAYANLVVNKEELRFKKFHYLVNQQMLDYQYVFENYYNWFKAVDNYQMCVGDKDVFTHYEEVKIVADQVSKDVTVISDAGHATFYDNPKELYQFILKMFN